MKCNVGKTDAWLRIIAGVILIALLGVIYKSWWSLIGIVLLATGVFRFCPLYVPLKFSTLEKEEKK